jgi:hypothetical protein
MFLRSDDPELDLRVHSKVGQSSASILVPSCTTFSSIENTPVGSKMICLQEVIYGKDRFSVLQIKALLAPFGPLDVIAMRKTYFIQSFCQHFMSLAGRLLLQDIGRFTSGGHQPNTCRLEGGRLQLGQLAGSR